MSTLIVLDANLATQQIGAYDDTGRAVQADSVPMVLSSEDFAVLSGIQALGALNTAQIEALTSTQVSALSELEALPANIVAESLPIVDCSFTKTGAGLIADEATQIGSTGSGMTVAQAYGNLLIDTGTTVNSEFLMRSNEPVTAAHCARIKAQLSQRIVNQHFGFYLADLIATGAAFTTDATGLLITVALPPGHGFTSQNVGQSCFLGGGAGAATIVPGRYAITAVSGNDVTFSPVFDCTWSRSSTTATITFLGGNPIFSIAEAATVSASSDTGAIVNGVVSLLTQTSGGISTFTCLNAGATTGTLTLTMTAKAWTPSSAGTITVFGWNCISMIKNGTSATVTQFDSQRKGWGSGATLATTTTDASPGHVLQVNGDTVSENFCDASPATATTTMAFTQRAWRLDSIVDAETPIYVFIQVFNGVTAPATTTRLTVGKFALETITINKQLIAGFSQGGSQTGLRVTMDGGTTAVTVATAGITVSGAVAPAVARTSNPLPVAVCDPTNLTRTLLGDVMGQAATIGAGESITPFSLSAWNATPAEGTVTKTILAPNRECEIYVGFSQISTTPTIQIERSFDNITFEVMPMQRIENTAASQQFGSALAAFTPVLGAVYRGKTYGAPWIRVHSIATSGSAMVGLVRIVPQPAADGITVAPFTLTAANTTESAGTANGAIAAGGVRTLRIMGTGSAKCQLIVDAVGGTTGTNTLLLEGSVDGTTYTTLAMQPLGGGATVSGVSWTSALSLAQGGIWEADVSNLHSVRARASQVMTTTPQMFGALKLIPIQTGRIASNANTTSRFTSTSSATLLAANAARKLVAITNEGAGTLYIREGTATASATDYTWVLAATDSINISGVTQQLTAIFSSAGTAMVSELT